MNNFYLNLLQLSHFLFKALPTYSLGLFVVVFASTLTYEAWQDELVDVPYFNKQASDNAPFGNLFVKAIDNKTAVSNNNSSGLDSYSIELVEGESDEYLESTYNQDDEELLASNDEFNDENLAPNFLQNESNSAANSNTVSNDAGTTTRIFSLLNNIIGGSSSAVVQTPDSQSLSVSTSASSLTQSSNDNSQTSNTSDDANNTLAQNSVTSEVESYNEALEAIKAERRKQVCDDWNASGKSLSSLQLSEQYLITRTFNCL